METLSWRLYFANEQNQDVFVHDPTWAQIEVAVRALRDGDRVSCMSLRKGAKIMYVGGVEHAVVVDYMPNIREEKTWILVDRSVPLNGKWRRLTHCGTDKDFNVAIVVSKELALVAVKYFFETETLSDQFIWLTPFELPPLEEQIDVEE
jgi:hypothetical protein